MSGDDFGLSRRPFRAAPGGAEVFIGPQTARVMQSMKKALTSPDAVAVVLGPAGTGKTTLVRRAIDGISDEVEKITVARMQLAHDEILELLLDAFGADDVPASTIKKISLFKRLLIERAKAGKRVAIIVEDAIRIGEDALAELEALTEPDGLENEGAHLVLMGDQSLIERLKSDSLVRLSQRVRLYQHVQPLSEAELQAYLKHCFRLAGGEFDQIFADGSAELLHELSGGVPRIVNKLVESVLAGADAGASPGIDTGTIARIAKEEFGLASGATPEPVAEEQPADPLPAAEKNGDGGAASGSESDRDAEASGVPELIQDTLPDLETMAPELAASAAAEDDDPSVEIPTLFASQGFQTPAKTASGPATPPTRDPEVTPESRADTEPELELEPEPTPEPEAKPEPGPEAGIDDLPELELELEPEQEPESPPGPVSAAKSPGTRRDAVSESGGTTAEPGRKAAPDRPRAAEKVPGPATDKPPRPASAPRRDDSPATLHKQPPPRPKPDPEPDPAPEPTPQQKPAPKPQQQSATKSKAQSTPATKPKQPAAANPNPKPAPVAKPRSKQAPAAAGATRKADNPGPEAEIPDWERDPTLAELRPDMDALEAAMASFAEPEEKAKSAEPEPDEPPPDVELRDPTIPSLPEITLDSAIEESIAQATADVEKRNAKTGGEVQEVDGTEKKPSAAHSSADNDPVRKKQADAELQTIAAGLARAKSLDDVDDKMAETLFGEEFSAIAAQIAANPPRVEDDEPSETVADQAPAGSPAGPVAATDTPPSPDRSVPEQSKPEKSMEEQFVGVYGQEPDDISMASDEPTPGMDVSASQRLATVRALDAEREGRSKPADQREQRPASPPPPAIEDQIDTSLTQTMKTLQAAAPANDDGEEEKKGGFFSRFRRG